MATKIRLRRVGRKRQASFRIVVAGSIHANSGRVTETIGKYNPRTSPSYIEVDEARALYWLREGAEMSESVRPLFRKVGLLEKYAKGGEPAGLAVRGEAQGKTVLATRPTATTEAKPAEAEKEKKPKAEKAEPKAEAKAEPKPEAEAEAKAEADVAEPEAPEAEAEAKAEPKTEAKKGESKSKSKAKAAKEEAAEGEAAKADAVADLDDEEEKSDT